MLDVIFGPACAVARRHGDALRESRYAVFGAGSRSFTNAVVAIRGEVDSSLPRKKYKLFWHTRASQDMVTPPVGVSAGMVTPKAEMVKH